MHANDKDNLMQIKHTAQSVAQAEEREAIASKKVQHDALRTENLPELIIITGLSGAGRTEAIHVFEDLGYFCIDNLPAVLLNNLVSVSKRDSNQRLKLAVVCDARNGEYFLELKREIDKIDKSGVNYRIIFLEASDDKLIARYKSSRRRHPMCTGGESIAQGIKNERNLLYDIRQIAHYVINTTDMLPQVLRTQLRTLFQTDSKLEGLSISVYSFGFKNGSALDADLVIDVRFLPNPYWDPKMRPMSGLDAPVHDFVLAREETKEFLEKWYSLLDTLIPGYIKEGKQQLAIAIGCTGGQHRSVTITEATGDYLKSNGYRVSVAHRDLSMAVAMASGRKNADNFVNNNPGLSGKIPHITNLNPL